MSSDIHNQKALLASRKSHSQLFHPFAEPLEFQKQLEQEALMQEAAIHDSCHDQELLEGLADQELLEGLAEQGQSLYACHVLPAPFLSSPHH